MQARRTQACAPMQGALMRAMGSTLVRPTRAPSPPSVRQARCGRALALASGVLHPRRASSTAICTARWSSSRRRPASRQAAPQSMARSTRSAALRERAWSACCRCRSTAFAATTSVRALRKASKARHRATTGGDVGCGATARSCGGGHGARCAADEYCAFSAQEDCGGGDESSVCQPRPESCDDVYEPVCGCDNRTYSNACEAARAGWGVLELGACQ